MTSVFINDGKVALLKEEVDTLDFKIIFLNSTFTPDVDGDTYLSDISADRASGSTDQALVNVTITANDTTDKAVFDADDVVLTSQTFDASDKIGLYIDTTVEATSEVIAVIDIAELEPVGDDVTVTWNASGIFAI